MKKLTILLFFSLLCTGIQAQIMLKDSTVQVIGYWELGDKYEYDYINLEYDIIDGDTLPDKKTTARYSLEVVDSTANSYTLELREISSNYQFKDTLSQQIMYKVIDNLKKTPNIRILTNEYGRFQNIANWDEIQNAIKPHFYNLQEEIKSLFSQHMIKDQIEGSKRDSINQMINNMVQYILQVYSNKELYLKGIEYITDMYAFHGNIYDINKHHYTDNKVKLPFEGAQPIDTQTDFFIYDYNTESSEVDFTINQYFDTDQLLEESKRFLSKIYGLGELPPAMPDKQPYLFMESYTNYGIHTNAGWMLWMYHKHSLFQGTTQRVNTWQVDMVFD